MTRSKPIVRGLSLAAGVWLALYLGCVVFYWFGPARHEIVVVNETREPLAGCSVRQRGRGIAWPCATPPGGSEEVVFYAVARQAGYELSTSVPGKTREETCGYSDRATNRVAFVVHPNRHECELSRAEKGTSTLVAPVLHVWRWLLFNGDPALTVVR